MNQEIKKKWVDALRSGEYKQGYAELRTNTEVNSSFCCLGVLCDLYSKEHNIPWEEDGGFIGTGDVLPNNVISWAGLSDNPSPRRVGLGDTERTLVRLNDNGSTFKQIADIIEKEL